MLKLDCNSDNGTVNVEMCGTFKDIWCEFAVAIDSIANSFNEKGGEEMRDLFLNITREYIDECIENPAIMDSTETIDSEGYSIGIDMDALMAIKALADQNKGGDNIIDLDFGEEEELPF